MIRMMAIVSSMYRKCYIVASIGFFPRLTDVGALLTVVAVLRGIVAAVAGHFRQLLVGGLFLVQDFLQQPGRLFIAQFAGPFAEAAVRSDFVVLHFLRGGNKRGIDGGRFLVV